MVIEIKPLVESFPGHYYHSSKTKANLFAYAGADYLSACEILIKERNGNGRWHIWAELPLIHMSIELFVKALASFHDDLFDAKKYKHKTSKIINDYSEKIGLFKTIKDETKKLETIKELEKSWELVRYGESVQRCDGEEWKILLNVARELCSEYEKLAGLRIL